MDTIATTDAETEAFEDAVEAKRQLVTAANEALQLSMASAQPLIAKLKGLVSDLEANTVKLKRSSRNEYHSIYSGSYQRMQGQIEKTNQNQFER